VSQAVVYEYVPIVIEEVMERAVSAAGYVSKYRILETIHRVYVTRIVSSLLAPDARTLLTVIAVNTRLLETEYTRGRATVFVGVDILTEQATAPAPTGGEALKGATPLPTPV
jgi:hypothetical protein